MIFVNLNQSRNKTWPCWISTSRPSVCGWAVTPQCSLVWLPRLERSASWSSTHFSVACLSYAHLWMWGREGNFRTFLGYLVCSCPVMCVFGHSQLLNGELGPRTMEMGYWHPLSFLNVGPAMKMLSGQWFQFLTTIRLDICQWNCTIDLLSIHILVLFLLELYFKSCSPEYIHMFICMLSVAWPGPYAYLTVSLEVFVWRLRWLHTPALWRCWRWQSCMNASRSECSQFRCCLALSAIAL